MCVARNAVLCLCSHMPWLPNRLMLTFYTTSLSIPSASCDIIFLYRRGKGEGCERLKREKAVGGVMSLSLTALLFMMRGQWLTSVLLGGRHHYHTIGREGK